MTEKATNIQPQKKTKKINIETTASTQKPSTSNLEDFDDLFTFQ